MLAAHKVDATVQVIVGKPAIEAATKRRAVMLPYNEMWTDMSGNGLGTSRRTAAEKPDLVRRVNDALLKGLAYAVAHPREAGDIFHKVYPSYSADAAKQETELLAPYVRPEAGKPMGWIDENPLAESIALLESQGLIHASFMPSELVSFDLTPRPEATK